MKAIATRLSHLSRLDVLLAAVIGSGLLVCVHGAFVASHGPAPDWWPIIVGAALFYLGERAMFSLRFGRSPQAAQGSPLSGRYAVESYLDHHAAKLVRRFDAKEGVAEGCATIEALKRKLEAQGQRSAATEQLLEAIMELDVQASARELLIPHLPRFLYFDEYSELPGTVSIAELQGDPDELDVAGALQQLRDALAQQGVGKVIGHTGLIERTRVAVDAKTG